MIRAPRGYGSACKAGSEAALASSTILVYLDGDGSDTIEDLPRLVDPIERDEADFVIGSRIRGHAEPGSMLGSQIFAAHLISFLVRMLQGVRYSDMGAFRAIRRTSFEKLQMVELTYGWNLEMQIKAAQHKLHIIDVAGKLSASDRRHQQSLRRSSSILQSWHPYPRRRLSGRHVAQILDGDALDDTLLTKSGLSLREVIFDRTLRFDPYDVLSDALFECGLRLIANGADAADVGDQRPGHCSKRQLAH